MLPLAMSGHWNAVQTRARRFTMSEFVCVGRRRTSQQEIPVHGIVMFVIEFFDPPRDLDLGRHVSRMNLQAKSRDPSPGWGRIVIFSCSVYDLLPIWSRSDPKIQGAPNEIFSVHRARDERRTTHPHEESSARGFPASCSDFRNNSDRSDYGQGSSSGSEALFIGFDILIHKRRIVPSAVA